MHASTRLFLVATIAFACVLDRATVADDPTGKSLEKMAGVKTVQQELLTIELLIKDANGDPVAEATVKPWAIGSSQGHGLWERNKKAMGDVTPETVTTDATGQATVVFPKYANLAEQVTTTVVSVSVSHSDHPLVNDEHISVPIDEVHEMKLPAGAVVEVHASIDGESISDDSIRVISSAGRTFGEDNLLTITEDGSFRIPPMAMGSGEIMLVRIADNRATHFSQVEKFVIDDSQEVVKRDVELRPAISIRGILSDNVPRPVRLGRVKALTITDGKSWDEISWFDWAEIADDGSFVIEAWPQGQPVQIAALCNGFIAKSGEKPSMVTPERAGGGYLRAQVFLNPAESDMTVEMTPLVECNVELANAFGKPIEGATVGANPNIGWWNGGSQIYAFPLISYVDYLQTGKHEWKDGEGIFAQPFKCKSDENGKATMELPAGYNNLWAGNKRYQLPIQQGGRSHRLEVPNDDAMDIKLVLQPRGLDVLGDWEDLCGFVFG